MYPVTVMLQRENLQVMPVEGMQGLDGSPGTGKGGHDRDTVLDSLRPDNIFILAGDHPGRGIDDHLQLAILHHIDHVGTSFIDLVHRLDGHIIRFQVFLGPAGGDNVKPEGDKTAGDVDGQRLVVSWQRPFPSRHQGP